MTGFVRHAPNLLVSDVLVNKYQPDLVPDEETISLHSVVEVHGQCGSKTRFVEWWLVSPACVAALLDHHGYQLEDVDSDVKRCQQSVHLVC